MKELTVRFSDEYSGKTKEELLALLEREVDDFSNFMATIGDWKAVGPLNPLERTLIKSYLVHKVNGKIDGGK